MFEVMRDGGVDESPAEPSGVKGLNIRTTDRSRLRLREAVRE